MPRASFTMLRVSVSVNSRQYVVRHPLVQRIIVRMKETITVGVFECKVRNSIQHLARGGRSAANYTAVLDGYRTRPAAQGSGFRPAGLRQRIQHLEAILDLVDKEA